MEQDFPESCQGEQTSDSLAIRAIHSPTTDVLRSVRIIWNVIDPLEVIWRKEPFLDSDSKDKMFVEICPLFCSSAPQHQAMIHCIGKRYEMSYTDVTQVHARMKELALAVCDHDFRFLQDLREGSNGNADW
jgi:hypothetical protein